MTYKANGTELRFTEGRSFKFYRVYEIYDADVGDFRVLFQWGRIGTAGQSKVEITGTGAPGTTHGQASMKALALDKLESKRRKGYEHTWYREFDTVSPDVLRLAGVNERSQQQAQTQVDTNPLVKATVTLDAALRLATGTPAQQAEAAVMAKGLHETLDALRGEITQLEGGVEIVDMMISR